MKPVGGIQHHPDLRLADHAPTSPKNVLFPKPPNGLFASSSALSVEFIYFPLYSVSSSTIDNSSCVVLSSFKILCLDSEAFDATMKNFARFSYKMNLLNTVGVRGGERIFESRRGVFGTEAIESDRGPSMREHHASDVGPKYIVVTMLLRHDPRCRFLRRPEVIHQWPSHTTARALPNPTCCTTVLFNNDRRPSRRTISSIFLTLPL